MRRLRSFIQLHSTACDRSAIRLTDPVEIQLRLARRGRVVVLDGVHAPVVDAGRPDAGRPARVAGAGHVLRPDRLDGQHASSLLRQLGARLRVRVEECEVTDDDGDGQSDGEHAGEGAQRTDEHADVRLRRHVSVADRRHRDDRPPQADGNRREVVVRVVLYALGVEDQRGEDDDAEDEEEDEQAELVRARLERVDEDLQAARVARQLEEAHDADDAEELEDVVLLLQARQQEVEIERHGGDHVDHVDRRADEVELAVRHHQSDDDLEREPRVAHRLDVEEGAVRLRASLHKRPDLRRVVAAAAAAGENARQRHVADDGNAHVRMRLQAEREDRDDDEEDGHRRHDLKQKARRPLSTTATQKNTSTRQDISWERRERTYQELSKTKTILGNAGTEQNGQYTEQYINRAWPART